MRFKIKHSDVLEAMENSKQEHVMEKPYQYNSADKLPRLNINWFEVATQVVALIIALASIVGLIVCFYFL